MTGETEPEDYTAERWVYIGPHSSAAGTYQWRDGEGEILNYKKLKGRVFGAIYEVQVKRWDDNVVVRADPRYTGDMAEDGDQVQVRALKIETQLNARRLEKNTARLSAIDEAIDPLLHLAGRIIGHTDRQALANYVTARIMQA